MLSKLLKHELKATARYLLPLYLILLVLTIVDRIVLRLNIFEGNFKLVTFFLLTAYGVSVIAVITVTYVLMVIRFYKNLMTDEGYLMFTLPVKSHQLLCSKLLISMLWIIASIFAVLGSLYIVFATPENIKIVIESVKQAMAEVHTAFGQNTTLLIIELAAMCFISLINSILLIYVSIAVGQLFNGHKLVGAFAAYIGINTAMQTIALVIMFVVGLVFKKTITELDAIPQMLFPAVFFYLLLFSGAFYWITNYIFRNKLNLE